MPVQRASTSPKNHASSSSMAIRFRTRNCPPLGAWDFVLSLACRAAFSICSFSSSQFCRSSSIRTTIRQSAGNQWEYPFNRSVSRLNKSCFPWCTCIRKLTSCPRIFGTMVVKAAPAEGSSTRNSICTAIFQAGKKSDFWKAPRTPSSDHRTRSVPPSTIGPVVPHAA